MMNRNPIVSREEWIAARKQILAKEKGLTHLRDEINVARSKLPWLRVDKDYVFEGPNGRESLADLFDGRSQLIIYHFMFGPDWKEGCVGCSFLADHLDGSLVHLLNHDVSWVAVSRAPWPKIEEFQKRMGWKFKWMSSSGSDFNYDYHVSFTPEAVARGEVYYNFEMRKGLGGEQHGLSVFYKNEEGAIFHTYSSFARAGENYLGTYQLLDITPKGRNETGPNFAFPDWAKHHDKY
jgi:predicted dithiol-disulfide oxidoreductase (DUF899 family)